MKRYIDKDRMLNEMREELDTFSISNIESLATSNILEPDPDGDYFWLSDYYEGEQFYQVTAVMLAEELADFVVDRLYYHLGG